MSDFLHTIICGGEDFTHNSSNLQITTEDPGGDGTATWSVVYFSTDSDAPSLPNLGSEVLISDAAGGYWVGRLEEPQIDIIAIQGSSVGWKADFTARGYGATYGDTVYKESKVWPANTSFITIFQDICLAIGSPHVLFDASQIHANQTIPADSSDALGEYASALINRYVSMGDAAYATLTWGVRLIGGAATFEVRERDGAPTLYQVDAVNCISSPVSWPLQWVRNCVLVKWNQGFWFDNSTDKTPVSGIERDLVIDATSTIGSLPEAQYVAKAVLEQFAQPRPFGKSIVIDYSYGSAELPILITDLSGSPVPPWRVRAGFKIRVNGFGSGNANLPMADLFIKSTHWDEDARRLTIETEQKQSLAEIVGRVVSQESKIPGGAGSPQGINPGSGDVASGGQPSGATAFNSVAGGTAATLDKNGRLNASEMPEGWDIVSLNFVTNGGGSAITAGNKGWLGIDYNVAVERVIIVASGSDTVSTPTDCSIGFRIWYTPNMEGQTAPLGGVRKYLTQQNGTTQGFILNGGTMAKFWTGNMLLPGDSLWGIEVDEGAPGSPGNPSSETFPTCTAVVADIWLMGRRSDMPAVNISSHAPNITNEQATPGIDGVTITWDTDTICDGQVQYGTSGQLTSWSVRDGTVVLDSGTPPKQKHSILIPGVPDPAETYHGTIISIDGSGRKSTASVTW